MKKNILTVLFIAIVFTAFTQNNTPVDSFVAKWGTVYKGELIENHPGEYFKFRTLENSVLTVPYDSVSSHFFYVAPPVVKEKKEKEIKPTSHIVNLWLPKRNTGIVLTSLGLGVLGGGIALIAANPADQHRYSNSNGSGINFTGKAAVGFVLALVSPAFFISGSVIWAKASKRLRMERRRNEPIKNL
ncbi:MAG: hypothetical protein V4615_08550 [Bacteroidota bacterium]